MPRMFFPIASRLALGMLAILCTAATPLPRVPAGFTVELVAGPPLVERPVMANFDDQGRLYVVDSAGVNEPFSKLIHNPPHRIVILDDTDGDGRYDRRTQFADKLVMPQGVLPYRGAVYVASPPSVWKLQDTDGDGISDTRQAIVSEFGSSGNAADIHGPFAGPDGWLYLCDGRHGHKVRREDGTLDEGLAAGIFRFRPDGSGFERYAGGGMDNPVEIDFTAEGEPLGTVNILEGNPRVDCLVHWVDGGAYPRADQEKCLSEFKRTGELLPPVARFGHVAVSGLTRLRSSTFGKDYQDNLFIAIFNLHKVVRSVVTRNGATFQSTEEDFFVSDSSDFHPTDVVEDADGSLLVIDTGGWFRIGCPQSQIAKPELLGGIYRIRRTTAPTVADPRGLALKLETKPAAEMAGYLSDPRPALRQRAVERLVDLGPTAVSAVSAVLTQPAASVVAPRHAVEVLSQVKGTAAQTALRSALEHSDPSVRLTAVRALGLTNDPQAIEPLLALVVRDDSLAVRREAASTLGRLCQANRPTATVPADQVLSALFSAISAGVPDRFLEHAIIMAAIRIADRSATIPFLNHSSPQVRKAALIALDQMDNGNLTRELVTPLLDTDDPLLRNTALAIISHHQGWAGELLTLLRGWLRESALPEDRATVLRGVLLAQSTDPQIQKLIADALVAMETSPGIRILLWEVIARGGVEKLPESWLSAATTGLQRGSAKERRQIIAVIAQRSLPQYDVELLRLVDQADLPVELRIEALAAAAARLPAVDGAHYSLLKSGLKADAPAVVSLAAARACGEAPLSKPQLLELAKSIGDAGPLAAALLLRAFSHSADEQVGLALVSTLNKSPVAENLSPDELASLLRKYPETVHAAAAELLGRLGGVSIEQQKLRLQQLSPLTAGGDVRRGHDIFFGKKAACSGCHAVSNKGGRVGPDLSQIGRIRKGIDLVEAIAYPSASFARDFRPYLIVTDAGKVVIGIVSRQTEDAVYVRTADLAEIRIPRTSIEEMQESTTSIMPKGLDTTLSAEEFRDLLAYLQSLK